MEESLPWPVESKESVIAFIERTIPLNTRVAVFDHVTSNTALVFPLPAIARICRERGISVVVDGAHGLMAHPLQLQELGEMGVDYYVSNCHKWLCSPKVFEWVV